MMETFGFLPICDEAWRREDESGGHFREMRRVCQGGKKCAEGGSQSVLRSLYWCLYQAGLSELFRSYGMGVEEVDG